VPPVNSWPTFRSLSSVAYASHTNTVVTAPTGIVDGDILILGFAVGAASPPSVTLPAGFTLVGGSAQRAGAGGFNVDQYVAWKRASSESGSYTITHATASSNAFISVYSGCIATGSPIDTFARNVGTGTLTDTTNCVTSVANTMAVYIDHDWQGSGTRSPPTPMAERYENLEYSCDNPLLPAGSSGQVNATNGNNPGDPWGAWVIILLPASQAPAALVAPLSRAKLWLRPWQYQHIPAASISAGTVAYTMPAAVGAITLAGTATGLRAARILTAVTGAITLAGTATGLRAARILTAATGAIVLAGSAANLIYATTKTLIASTGSIVVAGTATGLRAARQLAATKGSITLAGTLTGLKFGRVLTAAKGSIVLAGLATGLRAARTLTAAKGSIVLTGFAAGLIQSSLKTLLATTGSIVLGGQAVTLRYARKLVVAKGTITLAGSLAALVRGRGLGAGTGAIVVAGQNVNLVHPVSYRMRADYSSIRVAGPEGRLSRSGTEQPGVLEFGRTAYLGRW
jgi:hypothetical protein